MIKFRRGQYSRSRLSTPVSAAETQFSLCVRVNSTWTNQLNNRITWIEIEVLNILPRNNSTPPQWHNSTSKWEARREQIKNPI